MIIPSYIPRTYLVELWYYGYNNYIRRNGVEQIIYIKYSHGMDQTVDIFIWNISHGQSFFWIPLFLILIFSVRWPWHSPWVPRQRTIRPIHLLNPDETATIGPDICGEKSDVCDAKTPSELTYVAKTPYIYIYVLSWLIYFLLGESIIFEHLQRNPRAISTAGERLGGRLLRDQRLRERLHLHQTGRARRWGEESGQPGTLLLAEGHLANGRINLGSKKPGANWASSIPHFTIHFFIL